MLTLTLTLMLTLTILLTRTLTLTLILTIVFANPTYGIHWVIGQVHYSSGFTTDFPVVLCHHSSAGVFQMMCRVRKYVPTRMMLCPRNFCGAPAYISSIGYALESTVELNLCRYSAYRHSPSRRPQMSSAKITFMGIHPHNY